GAVGQAANDFIERGGGGGAGAISGRAGGHVLDDRDLHVRGGELQFAPPPGNQDRGVKWGGGAPVDASFDGGQGPDPRGPGRLQFHLSLASRARSHFRPHAGIRSLTVATHATSRQALKSREGLRPSNSPPGRLCLPGLSTRGSGPWTHSRLSPGGGPTSRLQG